MFFFDFDDTLYSHQSKCVPESAQRVLDELAGQGHILVMATGRGREALSMFPKEIRTCPATQILLNGQIIYYQGQVVYENHIAMGDLDGLFGLARSYGIAYGGYTWDGIMANECNQRVKRVWTDFGGPMPQIDARLEKHHRLYQAQLYLSKGERGLLEAELSRFTLNWSHEVLVNLIHCSASKAHGMDWCMKRFSVPREYTYAFGDGFNDVEMIEAAGHGIAMGNSFALLQEKAEYVTDTAAEDGILKAMRHYGFM